MTMYRSTPSTAATTRRAARAAATAVAALLLAACGSGGDGSPAGHAADGAAVSATPSAPAAAHNDADVAFSTGMIPHHRQAVAMAELAPGRAASAEVKALAEQIRQAQAPEITTMSGWLKAWGRPVPQPAGTGHAGHDGMSGMTGTDGMMTAAEMTALSKSSGPAFDKAFLGLMVEHHRGAVQMARTELAQGADPASKKLAQSVVDAQTSEITRMKKLLTTP
ncbi:DUF305 domain-containing protein [Streptomyces sp. NPDC089919]|uniref:DUF305 domain-containing protein n=1 Tax=Streptomyces sp. NPDC089919 TaxID=3155188 RepID=UPI003414F688